MRWPQVLAVVEQLVAAGATEVDQDTVDGTPDGTPDHVRMRDPEGNEFCVL